MVEFIVVLTHAITDGFTSGVGGISSGRACFTSCHLLVLLVSAIRASFARTHAIVGGVFACETDA